MLQKPSVAVVLQLAHEEGVRVVLCRIATLEFNSDFGEALLIGSLAERLGRDEPVHLMLSEPGTEMLAGFFAGLSADAVVRTVRTSEQADRSRSDRPDDLDLES